MKTLSFGPNHPTMLKRLEENGYQAAKAGHGVMLRQSSWTNQETEAYSAGWLRGWNERSRVELQPYEGKA